MPELPRDYWDACVFLSYINEDEERVEHIESLLSLGRKEFQIITSVVSITEVAAAMLEQGAKELDPAIEKRINALWEPPTPIETVEFHPLLAYDARQLMRQAIPLGWSLKPMDAIHLATARRLLARKFLTYDEGLFKYAPLVGIPIHIPVAAQTNIPGLVVPETPTSISDPPEPPPTSPSGAQ